MMNMIKIFQHLLKKTMNELSFGDTMMINNYDKNYDNDDDRNDDNDVDDDDDDYRLYFEGVGKVLH